MADPLATRAIASARETNDAGFARPQRQARAEVLSAACATHPGRFVRKPPEPPALPGPAGIIRPAEEVGPTK